MGTFRLNGKDMKVKDMANVPSVMSKNIMESKYRGTIERVDERMDFNTFSVSRRVSESWWEPFLQTGGGYMAMEDAFFCEKFEEFIPLTMKKQPRWEEMEYKVMFSEKRRGLEDNDYTPIGTILPESYDTAYSWIVRGGRDEAEMIELPLYWHQHVFNRIAKFDYSNLIWFGIKVIPEYAKSAPMETITMAATYQLEQGTTLPSAAELRRQFDEILAKHYGEEKAPHVEHVFSVIGDRILR